MRSWLYLYKIFELKLIIYHMGLVYGSYINGTGQALPKFATTVSPLYLGGCTCTQVYCTCMGRVFL